MAKGARERKIFERTEDTIEFGSLVTLWYDVVLSQIYNAFVTFEPYTLIGLGLCNCCMLLTHPIAQFI